MEKQENYFNKLSFVDKIIQFFRFRHVKSFVFNGSVVADIGAGDGAFLKNIENTVATGYALDRYAKDRNEGKIKFIPFDSDSDDPSNRKELSNLDIVFSLAVIEHVHYPEKLIQNAFSMLRPKGILVITTPTPRSRWLLEFLAFKLGIASREEILEHRRYYWGYQLYNLMMDNGFSSAEWKEFEFGMNTILVATK